MFEEKKSKFMEEKKLKVDQTLILHLALFLFHTSVFSFCYEEKYEWDLKNKKLVHNILVNFNLDSGKGKQDVYIFIVDNFQNNSKMNLVLSVNCLCHR